MLKKILVPVDGSDSSWQALEYACEMGTKFASAITILHVIPPAYTISLAGPVPYIPDNIGALEDVGEKLLKMAQNKMMNYEYHHDINLELGNPSSRILAVAEEGDYDTIVMGSRGLNGLAEFFLGSVSTNVVQHAKIPVLIVKAPEDLCD